MIRILIDLDRTVLNTEQVIQRAQDLLKKDGVDLSTWEKVWPKHRKEGLMRPGLYNVWEHMSRYKKIESNDFSNFINFYEKLYLPDSGNWYKDSLKFVDKYKNSAEVLLITRGHKKFQALKIDKGDIRRHFDRVLIVPKYKGSFFNQVLSKKRINIFIDDNPYEVDSVKSHHPEVMVIRILRGKNIFRGKKFSLADFEVQDFKGVEKIVEEVSKSFTNEKAVVASLKKGKSAVYPTDTAYGLGVDALNLKAVNQLYRIKNRKVQPVSVLVSNLKMAKKYVEFSETAEKVFNKFMPGPLTLVLPVRKDVPQSIKKLTGGTGTLGIRVPDNKTALSLVKKLKRPITTPSANVRGGETSYTTAEAFKQFYGKKYAPDFYLDEGLLSKVKPSTLLSIDDKKIKVLRSGPITKKEILKKI